jgi:hypothetical protein
MGDQEPPKPETLKPPRKADAQRHSNSLLQRRLRVWWQRPAHTKGPGASRDSIVQTAVTGPGAVNVRWPPTHAMVPLVKFTQS